MPYMVNNGAVLQATLVQRYDAQTILNVVHFLLQGAPGPIDGPAALVTFNAAWNGPLGFVDTLANCQVGSLTYQRVLAQWIYPTRYAYRGFAPMVEGGQVLEDGLPANVAAAVLRQSDLAGPHERGTLHVAGLPITGVGESHIQPDQLAQLQTFADATLQVIEVGGGNLIPVLFNTANPIVSSQPVSASPKTTTRVMRRRTVGVGI